MRNNEFTRSRSNAGDERILILAPTGRDAVMTADFLIKIGLSVEICSDADALCQKISEDVGLIFLTGEALSPSVLRDLTNGLAAQPAWSDLPLIVLTSGGGEIPFNEIAINKLTEIANVTLIERPVRLTTLVSAVKSALRARRRQYDIRNRIAEEKRMAARLEELYDSERAARSEAEAANRLKDEFLATVSHELRTPLNAMLGWTSLLRSGTIDAEKQQHALEVIERNARSQAKIIEDILDVSRIITGKLNLEIKEFDAAAMISSVVESVAPAAAAKKIVVRQNIAAGDNLIHGDQARLQQVLWNLLTNSIKFTSAGGEVEVELRRETEIMLISVTDSGSGIEAEFLPHVFDRFRQADGTTTRHFGGLGLGLAIVRHLVEQHGGTVAVTSDGKNKGAVFTVRLPISQSPLQTDVPLPNQNNNQQNRTVGSTQNLAGLKILVVDDEIDTLEMLKIVLESSGAIVTATSSVADALKNLQKSVPDVIVSDIGMPGVNGYEFMENVRELSPERGGNIPAVALTAYARSEDKQRALRAGYQQHVAKPVEINNLMLTITNVINNS